jgi:hypothetical protein
MKVGSRHSSRPTPGNSAAGATALDVGAVADMELGSGAALQSQSARGTLIGWAMTANYSAGEKLPLVKIQQQLFMK